jgi:hypothetical protein
MRSVAQDDSFKCGVSEVHGLGRDPEPQIPFDSALPANLLEVREKTR